MKSFIIIFSLIFSALVSFTASSQKNYQSYQGEQQIENQQFSKAELAQMLAPIALYPDSLLTHILISSTYPIEIVEAHRWLKKNDTLNSVEIAQSIENFGWDASVKALVPFEQILSRLSEDLSWTQQLGDAFLQDESKVLESIQILREQADLAGNLDKMNNMEVSYEENNIIIEPLEKEVVYVPYYDTRMVYGSWFWSAYPPVYWTPHHRIYVNHYNPFYWHSGIHISFNYFFSTFHWHKRHVVVVSPYKTHHYRPRRLIASGGYAKRWSHKPAHRRGVAYSNTHTGKKYHSNRVKTHKVTKHLKNNHRQFKQRLSASKHADIKQKTKIAQTRKRKNLQATPKQYSANVQHNEARRKDTYKAQHNVRNVPPKRYKESANKHHNKNAKKSNNHSRKKQDYRSASVKTHRSKAVKARH